MKTSKFNIADYLDNKDVISNYLYTVLEEGNRKDISIAIGNIEKAIAKK